MALAVAGRLEKLDSPAVVERNYLSQSENVSCLGDLSKPMQIILEEAYREHTEATHVSFFFPGVWLPSLPLSF